MGCDGEEGEEEGGDCELHLGGCLCGWWVGEGLLKFLWNSSKVDRVGQVCDVRCRRKREGCVGLYNRLATQD